MAMNLTELPFLVIQEICLHLAEWPSSLACFVRVNRTLHETGNVYLYRDVSLDQETVPLFIASFRSDKARWIRSLSVLLRLAYPTHEAKLTGIWRNQTIDRSNLNYAWDDLDTDGRIRMLTPCLKRLERLRSFSLRVWRANMTPMEHNTLAYEVCVSSTIASLLLSLSASCTELELDCPLPIHQNRTSTDDDHHCDAFRKIFPRLEHVRFRLSRYCHDLLLLDHRHHVSDQSFKLRTATFHKFATLGLATGSFCGDYQYLRLQTAAPETYLKSFPHLDVLNILSAERLLVGYPPRVPGSRHGFSAMNLRQVCSQKTLLIPYKPCRTAYAYALENGDLVEEQGFELYCRLRSGKALFGHPDEVCALLDGMLWENFGNSRHATGHCREPTEAERSPYEVDLFEPGPRREGLADLLEVIREEAITGESHFRAQEIEGLERSHSIGDALPDGWEPDPDYFADLAASPNRIRRVQESQTWDQPAP